MKRTITIVALLLLLLGGGILWLSHAPIMPRSQPVEQAIPDDHIPH